MATLIMMASPLVYKLIYDQSITYQYRNPAPVNDYFKKPTYYNKYNLPLEELTDNNGNPIDPNKYTIVNGMPKYTPGEKDMIVQDTAKQWFVQWCEVATYYETERWRHIDYETWKKMTETPAPPPPGPSPVNGETEPGSPASKYAQSNVFRVMPTPLLQYEDWFILWDEADLKDPNQQ